MRKQDMSSKFLLGGMRMLASARQSQRLGFGHLVRSTTRGDVNSNGWCLRGNVHPEMRAEMRERGIQGQKGLLVTLRNGHGFHVLTQQSGTWQHRFVIALEGPLVRQCLRECDSQQLQLSLNAAHEPEPLLTTCSLKLPGTDGLPEEGADTSDYLYEQAALVIQMLLVQMVQIDGLPAVEDVCVSVVQTSGHHPELQGDLQLPGPLPNLDR